MQRSTNFDVGDIVLDCMGRRYYLLLSYIKTVDDWDLYRAIHLENGKISVWSFSHITYNKVA